MIKRMLIMSDSHGNTGKVDYVLKRHPNLDLYIHAGDSEQNKHWLEKRFNYFVAGNWDFYGDSFRGEVYFEFAGKKIVLIHGHHHLLSFTSYTNPIKALNKHFNRDSASVIIFGHLHKQIFEKMDGRFFVNPGSLTQPRDSSYGSYVILSFDSGDIRCDVFRLKRH